MKKQTTQNRSHTYGYTIRSVVVFLIIFFLTATSDKCAVAYIRAYEIWHSNLTIIDHCINYCVISFPYMHKNKQLNPYLPLKLNFHLAYY